MIEKAGTIRVLIVDDHAAVAESLHALLSQQDGFEMTAMAGNADEALRIVRDSAPDVVLMDQSLPGMSGAEAAKHVLLVRPETAVVMFSGGMSDDDLTTAVESGIRGYVTKGSSVRVLVDAVRRAAAGEILLAPAELARLLRRGRQRAQQRAERAKQLDGLTPREKDVLRLMAQAQDVGNIAERLGIGQSTARGYIQNILEKLEAHSKLEAVVRANSLGLLEL